MRVVVVDDEPVARRGLVRLLSIEEDVEVVGQASDGAEAMAVLRAQRPDIVFLDIEMPRFDGILVAEEVATLVDPPLVVFVTAYDRYAVRAFEMEAADYILKPFDAERLQQVLDRMRRQLHSGTTPDPDRRLIIREGGALVFLDPEEVDLLESEGNYVRIRTRRKEHLVRSTLKEMAKRLEPYGFVRISRSALVNLARVRKVLRQESGRHMAVLDTGLRISVSRRAVPRLRRAIEALSEELVHDTRGLERSERRQP